MRFATHPLVCTDKEARSAVVIVLAWLVANGIKIKFKTKNGKPQGWLMKLLSVVLFFNKGFFTKFTTVIGNSIYFTSEEDYKNKYARPVSLLVTLLHERHHIMQRKKVGLLIHTFIYLFPQVLALLSLGAFWNPWWLLCLIFLAPFPSPGRAWMEQEAYRISEAVMYWAGGWTPNTYLLAKNFTGSNYYYMALPWQTQQYMTTFNIYHEEHMRAAWDSGKNLPKYMMPAYLLMKRVKDRTDQKPRGAV